MSIKRGMQMDKLQRLIEEIQADEMTLPDEMMKSFKVRLIDAFVSMKKVETSFGLKLDDTQIADIIADIYRTGRHHEIKSIIRLKEKLFESSNS
jgi:hypothetical protein